MTESKQLDKIRKIVLDEIKIFRLNEAEKYRDRENTSWRDIGKEVGVSHVAASKIADRAMKKIAMVFLANQVEELSAKLDSGEISSGEYKKMLLMLTPIEKKASEMVKKPEFVEYFKSAYFGNE